MVEESNVNSSISEDKAVFGVIFAFICLISALFSCLISFVARHKAKRRFHRPFQFPVARKYSEMSNSDSNILY